MGWKNLFHCEIQQFPRQVLDYWFPNSESYEDITKTTFTKWKGKVDVLTGGFPCQPFSYAGSRKGAEDDRYLWPEMLRAIREIQPTWVVAENVVGITTMVQPSSVTEMGRSDFLFEESVVCREEYRYILDAITEESSRGNRGFTGFPSVQPTICRGDDGLPFDVDDLAISEGKWRKESIKAYGNAWVPQVALEIFKAIEEYNNN